MKVDNPQKLILELLIHLSVEHAAFVNVIANEYVKGDADELKELNNSLKEARKVARKNLEAQIQNHYGGLGNIDDLLKSL